MFINQLKSHISVIAIAAMLATPFSVSANENHFRLASASDDAEQFGSGAVEVDGKNLILGYFQGRRMVGLRYKLAIPKGAEITEATLQFKADAKGAGATKIAIPGGRYGQCRAF